MLERFLTMLGLAIACFAVAAQIGGYTSTTATWLLAGFGVLALVLAGAHALWRRWQDANREFLGRELKEAENLTKENVSEADAVKWATRTRDEITKRFGEGEAALFDSDAGLTFSGGTKVQIFIEGRRRRLIALLNRAHLIG